MNTTLRKEFMQALNYRANCMTPEPINYYAGNNLIIELSKGSGIFSRGVTVYGITVMTRDTHKINHPLSTMKDNLQEARDYIHRLTHPEDSTEDEDELYEDEPIKTYTRKMRQK